MKEEPQMLSDEAMYNRMKDGWRAGRPFTVCGNGSLPENTRSVRKWLPAILEQYDIKSINDAGAGDGKWHEGLDWEELGVEYRAFDLVPRSDDTTQIDITTETLPEADAIICRMVLNHLVDVVGGKRDETRISMAIERFRASGAKWLFATQFLEGGVTRAAQFARLDLKMFLGHPEAQCADGTEPNCILGMYKLIEEKVDDEDSGLHIP